MPEKAGKDFLLKVDTDGAGTYTTLGGLRSSTMTVNNEAIDVTNYGSSQWRKLLDGAGIKSMSIAGSGVHNGDAATLGTIRTNMLAGTLTNFQIVDDDSGDTFQGAFKIVSFERGGEYNTEQTYSVTLESSGEITVS